MKKLMWFGCGMWVGLTILSFAKASVPSGSRLSDDTAIYQNLSEIHVKKEAKLDFDSDVGHLAQLEERYHEGLPTSGHPRLKKALGRISNQKYSATRK
ncbi:MAG: hypothetical protein ABIQ95_17355 [Bdellovibrionia bacterium]